MQAASRVNVHAIANELRTDPHGPRRLREKPCRGDAAQPRSARRLDADDVVAQDSRGQEVTLLGGQVCPQLVESGAQLHGGAVETVTECAVFLDVIREHVFDADVTERIDRAQDRPQDLFLELIVGRKCLA